MMAGPAELQYLDITDFSPGIYADPFTDAGLALATPAPDGAATEENTSGCVANPAGGLTGGPSSVAYSFNLAPANTQLAPTYPILHGGIPNGLTTYRLIDFDAYGPAFKNNDYDVLNATTGTMDDAITEQSLIAVVMQGWGRNTTNDVPSPTNTLDRDYCMSWWKIFSADHPSPYTTTQLNARHAAFYFRTALTVHASHKRFGIGSVVTAAYFNPLFGGDWKMGTTSWLFMFAHTRDYAGFEQQTFDGETLYNNGMALDLAGPIGTSTTGWGIMLCTSAALEGSTFYDAKLSPTHLCIHGGRAVMAVGATKRYGMYANGEDNWEGMSTIDFANKIFVPNNGQLHYSGPGTFGDDWATGLDANKNMLGLTDEGATIINSLTSVNANQLFITTFNDGAVTVNGDMANPSIINLPGVESTYGITPHPTAVNGGVVYGSRSGIYKWEGGESSTCISDQLGPDFWRTSDMTTQTYQPTAPMGRMAYRAPYIFAPNGFFNDTRSGGWWRLNPAVQGDSTKRWPVVYRTDPSGYVWGAPAQWENTTAWPFKRLDPSTPETAWMWQSQPITVSRNRRIQIRELDFVVTGAAYLVVEILLEGAVVFTTGTITHSNNYPKTYSFNTDAVGTNLQLRVSVLGTMTLNRITLGWREDTLIRQGQGA